MDKNIIIRFATEEDSDDIFAWRNDPVTVKFSPAGDVKKEDHIN